MSISCRWQLTDLDFVQVVGSTEPFRRYLSFERVAPVDNAGFVRIPGLCLRKSPLRPPKCGRADGSGYALHPRC